MPFGLTNALASFQRLMEELFADWNFVFICLDDILIASKSFPEHISYITSTSTQKTTRGKAKSKAIKMYIDLLYISAKGVRPTHKNVLGVKEFPRLTTVKEVKRFLGLSKGFWG